MLRSKSCVPVRTPNSLTAQVAPQVPGTASVCTLKPINRRIANALDKGTRYNEATCAQQPVVWYGRSETNPNLLPLYSFLATGSRTAGVADIVRESCTP